MCPGRRFTDTASGFRYVIVLAAFVLRFESQGVVNLDRVILRLRNQAASACRLLLMLPLLGSYCARAVVRTERSPQTA